MKKQLPTRLAAALLALFCAAPLAQAQLSINQVGVIYELNFDETVPGVNEGAFAGTGFAPVPESGQLNSNAWIALLSSLDSFEFGDTETSAPYARGIHDGGATNGGIYSFQVRPGDAALGVKPTGTFWTPGSFTLRLENNTGGTIDALSVSYDVYVYNSGGRANSFNFAWSDDDETYNGEPALDFVSPEAADPSPQWESEARSIVLTGLSWASGDFFYLRWHGNDVSGAGSRDEFALDNIEILIPLAGSGTACNSTENSAVVATTPTEAFADNGDGTVSHMPTGLMWKRCRQGRAWNPELLACEDSGSTHSWAWDGALAQGVNESYAGYNDWRLPNVKELESIIERRCFSPALNFEIFPDWQSTGFEYWSSSPHIDAPDRAWAANLANGNVEHRRKSNLNRVRLVRDGDEFVLDPGAIYVSTSDSSAVDDSGCGLGPEGTGAGHYPCKTIAQGISRASSLGRPRVLVANGIYDEAITLANGRSLLGGYRWDTWERDVGASDTQIHGVSSAGVHDRTVVATGITAATVFEGFVIRGAVNRPAAIVPPAPRR